jgi:hypothetical protein
VADHAAGLQIIDLSDPRNPERIGFFETPGFAYDVVPLTISFWYPTAPPGCRSLTSAFPTGPEQSAP